MNKQLLAVMAVAASVGTLGFVDPAQAALALDTADIVADVATVTAFITTIGLAVLAMIFVAKGIRWARKAG